MTKAFMVVAFDYDYDNGIYDLHEITSKDGTPREAVRRARHFVRHYPVRKACVYRLTHPGAGCNVRNDTPIYAVWPAGVPSIH